MSNKCPTCSQTGAERSNPQGVHTGRYADEGDVVREALRVLERQEFDESPALEAAILEGVASPHQPYNDSVMDRIRQNARSVA
jgi:putative addiction module CopG family antidote